MPRLKIGTWEECLTTQLFWATAQLMGCSYLNNFPIVFPLNWEKYIISSRSYMKYFPAWARFFWWAVRWENFERSQYSKWVT